MLRKIHQPILHKQEREFLYERHIDFLIEHRAAAARVNKEENVIIPWDKFDWDWMTQIFNFQFAGRLLPGERNPRTEKRKEVLIAECAKIKEIRQLKGESIMGKWWSDLVARARGFFGENDV